jgi:addiction module HigA family antidote
MPLTLTWRTITDEVFTKSQPHAHTPGAVLREDVLPELGWTQTELAARLMVSRQTVSDLLHERKSVAAEMAIRIARAVGGTPESWLRMQEALDLWAAEMKFKRNPKIAPRALAA